MKYRFINKELFTVCEMDKKNKVIAIYYECVNLTNARHLKNKKIAHLSGSQLLEGTVVILHDNKIVN